jgi:hypothetical protein
MSLIAAVKHSGLSLVCAMALVAAAAAPASAQDAPADPNAGNLALTVGIDALNTYMFRGIRQDDTEVITWPYADLGMSFYSGDGGLKSVGVNVGTWNSLHSGAAGADGPSGKLWYESDFYATLGLGFGGGVSLGTTYTAYTSPNSAFGTVKEVALKLAVDDSGYLGRAALKPYGLVAFELDGQADGGTNEGTYLELGVTPGWAASAVSLAFPVKVGLSLSDYYELEGLDQRFGYFSVSGIVTVPISGIPASYGSWNLHGGLEYQALGEMTKALNADDGSKVIGSFGIGLSY